MAIVTLIIKFCSLLQLVVAVQGCMEDCSTDETLFLSPPSMTEEKVVVLHSKCHSVCMNQLIGGHSGKSLDCNAIQSIESCQEGCLLRNSHPKKMINKVKCVSHCVKKCGELDGVKWKRSYTAENCPKLCTKESCEKGCSVKHIPRKKDLHLTLPSPEIKPVMAGHFQLSMTKLYDHNDRDLRVAMVIKIKDMATNNTYYDWQPGLSVIIDLRYFTCKQLSLSIRVVFGNQMTPFSSSIVECISTKLPKYERNFFDHYTMQLLSKLEAVDKTTDELLEYVNSELGTSSTAKEITAKLEEMKHKMHV